MKTVKKTQKTRIVLKNKKLAVVMIGDTILWSIRLQPEKGQDLSIIRSSTDVSSRPDTHFTNGTVMIRPVYTNTVRVEAEEIPWLVKPKK